MPKKNALPSTFEDSYKLICEKVRQFDDNFSYYKDKTYLEAEVRSDFLDPLFIALGWDVLHVCEMHHMYVVCTVTHGYIDHKHNAHYAFVWTYRNVHGPYTRYTRTLLRGGLRPMPGLNC